MLNIWYISKYATSSKYNASTRHFYLSEEWVKVGYDVTIFSSNSSHLSEISPSLQKSFLIEFINGVRVVWFNILKSNSSSGIKRIVSWLIFDIKLFFFRNKNIPKPNVIIVSSLSLTTVLPAYLLSKIYNCKFIFEVRDIWPLSVIVLGNYSKYNPFIVYLSWLEKFGYKKSTLVVGTMPNLSLHVNVNYKIKTKTICIPQGLNLDFYKYNTEILEQYFIDKYIPKNKFIVCYAGSMNANNPLETLLKAARVCKNNNNIYFVLIGVGNNRENLRNQVSDLNNVVFPPPVSKNKVLSLLNHVDVCYDACNTEIAKYGLSRNKWIDYMFSAKPIICSYDGFKSMINEAQCGKFIKFNDEIELANIIIEYSMYTKEKIIEMGIRGKDFLLQNRTFDKLAKKYLEEIIKS